MLPCTAPLGHLDNIMVVSEAHLPHVTVRSLTATAGSAPARKETSHSYPGTFAAPAGSRTCCGERK